MEKESAKPRAGVKSATAFRTISEVSEELEVPQHVLRFWETKFPQVRPLKRGGGRRYYRPEDVALLRRIQRLLYSEGYTIKGVQRLLKDQRQTGEAAVGSFGAEGDSLDEGLLEESFDEAGAQDQTEVDAETEVEAGAEEFDPLDEPEEEAPPPPRLIPEKSQPRPPRPALSPAVAIRTDWTSPAVTPAATAPVAPVTPAPATPPATPVVTAAAAPAPAASSAPLPAPTPVIAATAPETTLPPVGAGGVPVWVRRELIALRTELIELKATLRKTIR